MARAAGCDPVHHSGHWPQGPGRSRPRRRMTRTGAAADPGPIPPSLRPAASGRWIGVFSQLPVARGDPGSSAGVVCHVRSRCHQPLVHPAAGSHLLVYWSLPVTRKANACFARTPVISRSHLFFRYTTSHPPLDLEVCEDFLVHFLSDNRSSRPSNLLSFRYLALR